MAPTDKRVRLTLEQKSKLIEESLQPGFIRSKAYENNGISMAVRMYYLCKKFLIIYAHKPFNQMQNIGEI